MRRIVTLFSALTMSVSLVACNQPTPPTPGVTVEVLPPPSSPTPIVCTENPPGLTLAVQSNVTPSGTHQVRVAGQGFEPGEHLIIVLSAETETHATRLEASLAQGVNPDGTFTLNESLTPPPNDVSGQTSWNLAVVHQRGVACMTFTVP
jgi:hypothetical protein